MSVEDVDSALSRVASTHSRGLRSCMIGHKLVQQPGGQRDTLTAWCYNFAGLEATSREPSHSPKGVHTWGWILDCVPVEELKKKNRASIYSHQSKR